MWRYSLLLLTLVLPHAVPPASEAARNVAPADPRLLGRWDITIRTPDGERPSWIELWLSGRDAVVGQFVGVVGSARPISHVLVSGDSLHFTIPHQWENGEGELTVDGRLTSERLAGSMTFPDG